MVGQPVLYLGQADVKGIDVPSGDFHDVSVCAVGWEGGRLRLWEWAVLYSGLVYFSIWAESGRPRPLQNSFPPTAET